MGVRIEDLVIAVRERYPDNDAISQATSDMGLNDEDSLAFISYLAAGTVKKLQKAAEEAAERGGLPRDDWHRALAALFVTGIMVGQEMERVS